MEYYRIEQASRCPPRPMYHSSAANFPATMLPLHASLTASRQFLASMGRRYLGCYTGNMRHNLIPNARPSEMVQQNLFILYSKHIVVHNRNRVQGVSTQTFIFHFALAGRNMQVSCGLKVIWES